MVTVYHKTLRRKDGEPYQADVEALSPQLKARGWQSTKPKAKKAKKAEE